MRALAIKTFAERHPLAFSLLLTSALFGLAFASMAAIPRTVVSNVGDLPLDLKAPPSEGERALTLLPSPENLFWVLGILLAALLLTGFGWWREAGFNRPSHWRNSVHLLSLPLLVGAALALPGGIRVSGPAFFASALLGAFLAAFGEETLYRGLVWRVLAPTGLVRAVLTTSLLSGILLFGRLALAGPWPEALLLAIPAVCAGFTYAALRWRTASIWPAILLHFALTLATNISAPVPYLFPPLVIAGTLGFVGYGLFLLRRLRGQADGSGSTFC